MILEWQRYPSIFHPTNNDAVHELVYNELNQAAGLLSHFQAYTLRPKSTQEWIY